MEDMRAECKKIFIDELSAQIRSPSPPMFLRRWKQLTTTKKTGISNDVGILTLSAAEALASSIFADSVEHKRMC